ncbi:MAG TPA: ABC transporter permease, partial [Longimicrobiales bacterium]
MGEPSRRRRGLWSRAPSGDDAPPRWRCYLRFWGADPDADIEDELRFHLEMREQEYLAAGLPPEAAKRRAAERLGDLDEVRAWLRRHDRRKVRRTERVRAAGDLLQDARHALRRVRREPAFSAAVIAVLGLGIGAATAMFSVVDAALLRPLPFEQDERLVVLDEVRVPLRLEDESLPKGIPDLTDLDSLRAVFSGRAAYAPGSLNLTGAGDPLRVKVTLVTTDFFSLLGVRPALGRAFTPEEGEPGAGRVAILSHGLWLRQFGADPEVTRRSIELNGVRYRVVGVMPRGFTFPAETELWTPLPVPFTFDYWEPLRMYLPSVVLARLAPGVMAAQAGERMLALVRAYREMRGRDPDEELSAANLVRPLRDVLVSQRRTALLVLMGATVLMLLIACANVANLLLSRSAARRREIALRGVLGAAPARILRQLLVESLVLSLAGAALGIALAYAATGALDALLPADLVGVAPPRVDARVLAFALVVGILAGVASGVWPGLDAFRADAGEAIRSGGPVGGMARGAARPRRVLVSAELALALVLLVGAGVMLRSFLAVLATDPGLRPERVATLELTLASATYGNLAARRQFYEAVLERLYATPGIEAAAVVNELPLRGPGAVGLFVAAAGREPPRGEEPPFALYFTVTPEYFRALGIPLLRGRTLSGRAGGPKEVVIDELLARRLWPGEDPVGQGLVVAGEEPRTVVGVVANVRSTSLEDGQPAPQ